MRNNTTCSDMGKLHNQIENIDSMCQIQLGQINALSVVMLRAMETPEFWQHPSTLRDLIGLVQGTADDLMDYVNGAAEEVGCNYVDETDRAQERRIFAAFQKARAGEANHV